RIWGSEHVRVFLSHKATVKENTSQVKQALARCGISAFVAHEDIEPTEEWQREIERALFSMDALVALLSDDFHDSNWTDQEVGVAIGRGVPLIAVRLGMDPYGLMGKGQGLGGCGWSDPNAIAVKVFQLLHKRLPEKSRLFECALSAYSQSRSFADSAWKVEHLLSVFDSLSTDQVNRLVEAYRTNGQNTSSFRGMDLLQPLLEKWTGEKWTVRNNELQRAAAEAETEIPF
ncbi:MAG: toll/interleukin-1 receptor domain-containing protein, partial [Rhodospirillales bacterium]|nr:toll/interleukin-1 receptor domain-containing protein [Rhodospirillales bacterium]